MTSRVILGWVLSLACGAALAQDFSPLDVGGLVAWYDARSLYGEQFKLRDGASVELWHDSSGNGHDLVAEGKGLPAVFHTLGLNELPLVELQEAAAFLVTDPFDLDDHTIVLVHATSKSSRALFSSEADAQLGVVLNADGGRHKIHQGLKSQAYNLPDRPAGFRVTTLSREGLALRSTVDGADRSAGVESAGTLRVGRMFNIRFSRAVTRDAEGLSVAELLLFDRALGKGELASLVRHLADKYGIQLVNPGSEPDPTTAPKPGFDWSTAKILAQLSTTSEQDLNSEDGVPILWDVTSGVASPFRHDPGAEPSRLYCTRDGTKVQLAVSLELAASDPGTQLGISVLKNREDYVGQAQATEVVADVPGHGRLAGRHEISLTLDAGDYIEIVVARNAGPGTVTALPLTSFLLATTE